MNRVYRRTPMTPNVLGQVHMGVAWDCWSPKFEPCGDAPVDDDAVMELRILRWQCGGAILDVTFNPKRVTAGCFRAVKR